MSFPGPAVRNDGASPSSRRKVEISHALSHACQMVAVTEAEKHVVNCELPTRTKVSAIKFIECSGVYRLN
jgi:hypothetical protein